MRGESPLVVARDLLARNIWPERFKRNAGLISPENQARLFTLPIFVAGLGGLGGAIAALLARVGAAKMTLCDFDRFEESNLNRQRFCDAESLGKEKVLVAAAELQKINPWGQYKTISAKIAPENATELLAGAEIVVDGLDSVDGKIMLETAAIIAGAAWLYGAVLEEEGFLCLRAKPDGLLTRLYGDKTEESGAGPILPSTVSGVAAIMCAEFGKWLANPAYNGSLIHVDFSRPALETFAV